MSRSWFLVTMCIAAVIAGCVSETPLDDPVAPTEGDRATQANELPATDEPTSTHAAMRHQPHVHDYWAGREVVRLLDVEIQDEPEEGLGHTLTNLASHGKVGIGGARVTFPDGTVVYEGTGRLDVTATWQDMAITSIGLRTRTAASADYGPMVELSNGKALSLEVTPSMTDLPHAKNSEWVFEFFAYDNGDSAQGVFHLTVDAFRMSDLMAFPPHPDFFAQTSEIVLLDADAEWRQTGLPYNMLGPEFSGQGDPGIAPTHIVPEDTAVLEVTVDVLDAQSTGGELANITVAVRPADQSSYCYDCVILVEGEPDAKRLRFLLPVDPKMTDSPYADESAWAFYAWGYTDGGNTGVGLCGGCFEITMKYHISVRASNDPDHFPPAAE